MGDHFDELLPTRLTDLADVDPTPVSPALLATIRGRAATQRRHRRGVALVVAAAALLAGLGGGAAVRAAILDAGPAVVPPAGVPAPLDWPVRGDLEGSPAAALTDQATAVWDQQSTSGPHRQVRLLLSLEYQSQHIRVLKGTTPDGQGRIAVLASAPEGTPGTEQDARRLQVSLDVAAPASEPEAILVTLAGLGSPAAGDTTTASSEGIVVAMLAPGTGRATVRWTPATAPFPGATGPVVLEVDPSKGYRTQDTRTQDAAGLLTPGPALASAFTLATADGAGQPLGFTWIEPGDGQSPVPPVGIPHAAILVPQRPAVSVSSTHR